MEVKDHLTEVFEFAKKMELDGKAKYEEELAKTEDPGLKSILKMLIDAEVNHYEVFDAMQQKHSKEVIHTSLKDVKNIFQEIKEKGEKIITSEEHADFYLKAKEIEEKAEETYRKEAQACEDEEVKKILIEIADEEHRHVILMQSLHEMVLNPNQWVENAEFNEINDF